MISLSGQMNIQIPCAVPTLKLLNTSNYGRAGGVGGGCEDQDPCQGGQDLNRLKDQSYDFLIMPAHLLPGHSPVNLRISLARKK